MLMFDNPPRHRSYILTFWEERSHDPDTPAVWRFSLEDPHTGQRRGFADLKKLLAALQQEVAGKEGERPNKIDFAFLE
jgi:hypothetical protein